MIWNSIFGEFDGKEIQILFYRSMERELDQSLYDVLFLYVILIEAALSFSQNSKIDDHFSSYCQAKILKGNGIQPIKIINLTPHLKNIEDIKTSLTERVYYEEAQSLLKILGINRSFLQDLMEDFYIPHDVFERKIVVVAGIARDFKKYCTEKFTKMKAVLKETNAKVSGVLNENKENAAYQFCSKWTGKLCRNISIMEYSFGLEDDRADNTFVGHKPLGCYHHDIVIDFLHE